MAGTASVFTLLGEESRCGPIAVAHRGNSSDYPENTLPAFASAMRLGVTMQEFDVRPTRDGVLVCIHDPTFDRTTDAATRLGPGALVAQTTWDETRLLDAGAWRGAPHRGVRVPSLREVLDLLEEGCIAMLEHKAGNAKAFVAELRLAGAERRAVLQSFDWHFVADAKAHAPDLALALLGPTPTCPQLDATAIHAAKDIGAGMLHWSADEVTTEAVACCHAAGLLLCTYTTDDDLGLTGGALMGVDAMCTNRPARMLELRGRLWQLPPPGTSRGGKP